MISITNTMKRTIVALFLFALAAISLFAQKQWTLQECIQYAMDNNLQVKRQELQSQVNQKDYTQSKFNRLPEIYGEATNTWNSGRSFDNLSGSIVSNYMSTNFEISGSALLFGGFQVKNTIEQNRYILEKSLQDYQKTKNDISLQIATAYLQILFNQEALYIAQSQFDVVKLQAEKTKKLVDAGSKSRGELLQMQAQQANENYNVVNAQNNLNISNLTLIQLLELKDTSNFSIFVPDSIKIEGMALTTSIQDVYQTAESSMPEVKSAEMALHSTEQSLQISKSGYSPQLYLYAGYSTGYLNTLKKANNANYPFIDQLTDNNNKYVSLYLKVPIFSKMENHTNVSKSRLKILDAQYYLEQTKKNLYQEIQKAHADALAAFERFNSAKDAVTYNEEAFKYIEQKYNLGVVGSVDYNASKNDLIKSKSNLLQAKFEYIFKLKVLDFYKGIPLVL
jgi:outer membrane protein